MRTGVGLLLDPAVADDVLLELVGAVEFLVTAQDRLEGALVVGGKNTWGKAFLRKLRRKKAFSRRQSFKFGFAFVRHRDRQLFAKDTFLSVSRTTAIKKKTQNRRKMPIAASILRKKEAHNSWKAWNFSTSPQEKRKSTNSHRVYVETVKPAKARQNTGTTAASLWTSWQSRGWACVAWPCPCGWMRRRTLCSGRAAPWCGCTCAGAGSRRCAGSCRKRSNCRKGGGGDYRWFRPNPIQGHSPYTGATKRIPGSHAFLKLRAAPWRPIAVTRRTDSLMHTCEVKNWSISF